MVRIHTETQIHTNSKDALIHILLHSLLVVQGVILACFRLEGMIFQFVPLKDSTIQVKPINMDNSQGNCNAILIRNVSVSQDPKKPIILLLCT